MQNKTAGFIPETCRNGSFVNLSPARFQEAAKVGVSSSAFRHPTTDRQHNGCSAHLSPILGAEVGIPGARELTQLTTLLGRQHQAGKGSTRGVCCKDNLTGGTLVPVLLAPLATRQIFVCAPAFATCGLGSITSPICISCGLGSIL